MAATGPMTDAELERYADAIVRTCANVGPGDVVAISGEPAHRELVVALVSAAYRAGARLVDPVYMDPRVRRARILDQADADRLADQPPWHDRRMQDLLAQDAAIITINGEDEPGLLGDVDPQRAARETTGRLPGRTRYLRAVLQGRARFVVCAWPVAGWAAPVYPELDPQSATRRVAEDLLSFCRLGPDDAPTAWASHLETLRGRATRLDALDLRAVHLRADGTDLHVGLPADAVWVAADMDSPSERRFCANLPTEEVFTSPAPARVEGVFRCSRALALDGRFIEGIEAELRGGRLVRIGASTASDTAFLQSYFAQDAGAGRLGELALVDRSSRIGQTGRAYGMTLLDENAAAHVALGSGFVSARRPAAGARRSAVNVSRTHVDVMIGTDDMDVDGTDARGATVPLIRDGGWVV